MYSHHINPFRVIRSTLHLVQCTAGHNEKRTLYYAFTSDKKEHYKRKKKKKTDP